MGLFEKIFPSSAKSNREEQLGQYFKTLTMYSPSFRTYSGGLYEMELTRSCVHSFASMCGKLKPEMQGSAYKRLEKTLQFKPNPWMDTYKFIYRIATILSVDGTAFIAPLYAEDEKTIVGLYPLLPQNTEVMEYKGEPWLRYTFASGQKAAIEMARVGIMTNHQYRDDIFGSDNRALNPTLSLMSIQSQGMEEAIRQSAVIRFMARVGNTLRPDDLEKERRAFSKMNLSDENTTGVMIFDAKYADVKQVDSKPFVVDAEQMALIKNNAFNYFGVNEDILQNKFTEDQFNAFYEGKLEPFALQLSLVISNMLFTPKELAFGNSVIFTANRLQYASNTTKLNVSTQLFDRGILTMNQVMDIWNLAHVEGGDERKIRGEYVELDENGHKVSANESAPEPTPEPEAESGPDEEADE